MESLEGMGFKMTSCVGLCLSMQVESNFVQLMAQTQRVMQLTLEYLKVLVLALSYSLSISHHGHENRIISIDSVFAIE